MREERVQVGVSFEAQVQVDVQMLLQARVESQFNPPFLALLVPFPPFLGVAVSVGSFGKVLSPVLLGSLLYPVHCHIFASLFLVPRHNVTLEKSICTVLRAMFYAHGEVSVQGLFLKLTNYSFVTSAFRMDFAVFCRLQIPSEGITRSQSYCARECRCGHSDGSLTDADGLT